MFDVGFSELMMVALVSLLVIGPERLPKFARIAGYWVGKTRRMIEVAKAEISAELHAEEIRQAIKEQNDLQAFQSLIDDTRNATQTLKSSLESLPQDSLKGTSVSLDKERHDAK